jgi:hypothetical protein
LIFDVLFSFYLIYKTLAICPKPKRPDFEGLHFAVCFSRIEEMHDDMSWIDKAILDTYFDKLQE